jgi:NAD(P)-dependent dehydrogenase (short-subunit alcohol dehydrogenase family)
MRLQGSTALLTGATGGLGRYIARALADRGTDLALSDRPEAELGAAVEECRSLGVRAEGVPADLIDPGQLGSLVDSALASRIVRAIGVHDSMRDMGRAHGRVDD